MQHNLHNQPRSLSSRFGLALIGLAVCGIVGLTPTWASAAGTTDHTFTSPIATPTGRPPRPNVDLRELLEQIIDGDAILADILGLTPEELATAQASGVKLRELIEQAGLDQKTVREAVQEAVDAAIDEAVSDGVITQEQAALLLPPPTQPERGKQHRPENRQAEESQDESRQGEERQGEDRQGGEQQDEDRQNEQSQDQVRQGEERQGEDRPGEERPDEERQGGEQQGEERQNEESQDQARQGEERQREERRGEDRQNEEHQDEERPDEEQRGEEHQGEE